LIFSGNGSRKNDSLGRVLNTTGFSLLLAQLEQQSMYNAYNFSQASSNATYSQNTMVVGSVYVNTTVIGSKISAFNCPSDIDPVLVTSYTSGTQYNVIYGMPSNYGFCCGWYSDYDNPGVTNYRSPAQYRGIFYCDLSTAVTDIKDGTSSTAMIGETRQEHSWATAFTPYWGCGSHTAVTLTAKPTYYSAKPYPSYLIYLPNANYSNNARRLSYAWVMSSTHPGGINVCFADGSVHFIKNSINPNTWWAINTMNGQEVVSSNQFQ
jgi:prepilin-type processing-associated H-X9-DG protein